MDAFGAIAKDPSWRPERSCVLLSGGLDSAIVAEIGGPLLGLRGAITVIASEGATDLEPACRSAAAAGLEHHVVRTDLATLLRAHLPTVVRTLQSFDPMSLRNEVAIACALSEAAARGYTCAVTGDGADELLGGYSFSHALAPDVWAASRERMAALMKFGSVPLGRHHGVTVMAPFTQRRFVEAALRLRKEDCVACRQGSAAAQTPAGTVGKEPLRLLFPGVTSAGRRKDPIEVGCGTTALSRPGYWDTLVTDEAFAHERMYVAAHHGVELRDKEHLFYYRAFRETFPNGEVPGKPRGGSDPCPKCRYQMSDPTQTFCVTCGHYDPNLRRKRT